MTPLRQPPDRSNGSGRIDSRRPISRRTTLQSLGVLFTDAGAGCIGGSGASSVRSRWRKSIDAQPLLNGGRLYVTGRLTLHALSPTDGSTQWVTEYSENDFDQRLCLRSDITVDGRRIYVPGCDGLRAFRRSDGEQTWFIGSSLRQGVDVDDERVYANDEDILAIDAGSGDIVWRADTGGDRLTRPAATPDGVVFTNRVDEIVTAFDVDGEPRW